MTILTSFPCGCAAYRDDVGGMVEWGVRRCYVHFACGILPIEAEKYFDTEPGIPVGPEEVVP